MYNGSECAVQTRSGHTEWFQVKSGVKQGCNMSGFLFLLVIDWIMRKATADNSTGIRWKFTSKLEDLDFADDIALLSSNRQQIQTKTDRVNNIAGSTGLKINTSKTQVTRINPTSNTPVTLNGKDLEEVDSFIYLGATVSKSGGAADDMKRRLGLARIAFNKLSKIWKDSHIGRKTKKIFRSNVVSVLLFGSETWKVTKGDEKRLDVLLHSCLRRIFKIYWPEKISNISLRERAEMNKISVLVKVRRWTWIGHILRKDTNNNCRTALTWTPEGRRKRGRPKETWRRTVERERTQLGFANWTETARAAQDMTNWKTRVRGPILQEERRN